MKRTILPNFCRALACYGIVFFSQDVSAQGPSLWQYRKPSMTNLIADVKARRTGDLLFITINEQSDVENRDQRVLRKQNSSSSQGNGTYGLGGGLGTAAGNLNFDSETAADRSFNGDTEFRSEREFIDRFTVVVIDTFPNGNLLVSGKRRVLLGGDNRTLVLTGIVRSADINNANTVSSNAVANLQIRYEADPTKGAEPKFLNQGWLGKKLNKLWPY